jgi:hypothetical protein
MKKNMRTKHVAGGASRPFSFRSKTFDSGAKLVRSDENALRRATFYFKTRVVIAPHLLKHNSICDKCALCRADCLCSRPVFSRDINDDDVKDFINYAQHNGARVAHRTEKDLVNDDRHIIDDVYVVGGATISVTLIAPPRVLVKLQHCKQIAIAAQTLNVAPPTTSQGAAHASATERPAYKQMMREQRMSAAQLALTRDERYTRDDDKLDVKDIDESIQFIAPWGRDETEQERTARVTEQRAKRESAIRAHKGAPVIEEDNKAPPLVVETTIDESNCNDTRREIGRALISRFSKHETAEMSNLTRSARRKRRKLTLQQILEQGASAREARATREAKVID